MLGFRTAERKLKNGLANPYGRAETVKKSTWRRWPCSIMRLMVSAGLCSMNCISAVTDHEHRFHSEGSIVSCIFSLLFWDILFTPIPGAFETAYQTAPLDIDEDSFYYARQEKIENLLDELRAGRAAEILDAVDQRERPKGTWCIGVRWDMFERNDLIEIVEVREYIGSGLRHESNVLAVHWG